MPRVAKRSKLRYQKELEKFVRKPVSESEVNERESFTHCYNTRTDSLSREVSNKNQRDNKLQQNVVKSNIFHFASVVKF
jgi:hypothetical protein